MEPLGLVALLTGAFFLTFGLTVYHQFFRVLGAAAGLALWSVLREPVMRFPGLREHPGVAAVLLLIGLCAGGILLVTRFRRVLAFLGGFGTGVILAGMVASYFNNGPLLAEPLSLARPDAMGLLAGLVAGVLFLLFERFFAVILTSSLGAFLCAWALGGRWAFSLCFTAGLVAQLFIYSRFGRTGKGKGDGQKRPDGSRTKGMGTTVLTGMLLVLMAPSLSMAGWEVERVIPSGSRVVMGMGWRDGVRQGEHYAVLDDTGSMVTVITVTEVFTDSAYSEALPEAAFRRIKGGMGIQVLEDYECRKALELGGESRLQDFLRNYPQSRFRQDIVNALDKTRFRQAEMIGTIDSYLNFQRSYPTSCFASDAMQRAEKMAFQKAREAGTEKAFSDFLDRFSGTGLISGMTEVKCYFRTRETGLIHAFRDFRAYYPGSPFGDEFTQAIEEFEMWAERLEFGSNPVQAIRYFGEKGDETAVPLLVGKLTVPSQRGEARKAVIRIGKPAVATLLEVLISPLQSLELKDEVALIVGELGDVEAVPAMRSYVRKENTEAGRKALLMLEERAAR